MKNYELIEHTADIRIRVKAGDLKGLFADTAWAMFDIIAQRSADSVQRSEKIKIKVPGADREELFINWLNELLSLSSAKELIFSNFQITKLKKNGLEATATGESMQNYKVNTEVKAATYHQLKIEETPAGWQAEVIFDV